MVCFELATADEEDIAANAVVCFELDAEGEEDVATETVVSFELAAEETGRMTALEWEDATTDAVECFELEAASEEDVAAEAVLCLKLAAAVWLERIELAAEEIETVPALEWAVGELCAAVELGEGEATGETLEVEA